MLRTVNQVRFRRILPLAVAVFLLFASNVAFAQPAVEYRHFGPATPPGGFYPECGYHFYQMTFQGGNSSYLYGTTQSQGRYSDSGLTCAYNLSRPPDYLYSYTRLVNYYTGYVCHTVADTNDTWTNQFILTRFWNCGAGVSVQFISKAGYKWNGSWYMSASKSQCCEIQG